MWNSCKAVFPNTSHGNRHSTIIHRHRRKQLEKSEKRKKQSPNGLAIAGKKIPTANYISGIPSPRYTVGTNGSAWINYLYSLIHIKY